MNERTNEINEINEIMEELAVLAPGEGEEAPEAGAALAALRERLPAGRRHVPGAAVVQRLLDWRNPPMSKRQQVGRRLALASALVLLIAAVFSFPAARAAANNFLGLFRVQKFAPISISPEQIARLENLQLEEGIYPGQFEWIEEPGQPQIVDSLAAAARAAGSGWLLDYSHDLGRPAAIEVAPGGAGRLVVNLPGARAILEAAAIDPALLPDSLEGAEITARVPAMTMIRWDQHETVLIQGPSPEVDYPDGFDPAPIGQAVLQLLGMNEPDAFRLARSIDWTSTLILPIPSSLATFQEVPVGETTGLLITELNGQHAALIWQANERLFMLSNDGDTDALLALVD